MNGAAFICISNSKGWHRGSGGYNKHSLHSGPARYLWVSVNRHYVAMISYFHSPNKRTGYTVARIYAEVLELNHSVQEHSCNQLYAAIPRIILMGLITLSGPAVLMRRHLAGSLLIPSNLLETQQINPKLTPPTDFVIMKQFST